MSEAGPRTHALVVTGAPGAGKSTLAALLAARLGAALVDLDTATAHLTAVIAGLLGVDDLDHPRLARATRAARYETIVAVAEENLRLGLSVVLVAPFTAERRDPSAWRGLATRLEAAGGAPTLVWLAVDAETVASRLAGRGAVRDVPKLARVDAASGLDLSAPRVPHLRADGAREPRTLAEVVLAGLPDGAPGVS